ncbi:response regulator transcription factor [Aliikangiella coralliicola]|uniref:Response regulator transcription factor n=1 Tax=Aliikangiella coralliicola TaxID=2592383 RepID=A0A545UCQ8_9GAMM|nr:response regulator transcription factor [Aliikangiella coralliicola]TQV87246.1 response regulator transcription factor [Aliikangiella coralliicola]
MRILVVDDNRDIGASIIDYLEFNGHSADFIANGSAMLQLVKNNTYDLIILDVMMPGISGFEACQRLRENCSGIPVIFLTARDTLDDKLKGFDAGADDYLVKPFDMKELLARVNALGARGERRDTGKLSCADVHIDLQQHKVTRAGVPIGLNPIQFKLLELLVKNYPDVVTKNTLEYEVWGEEIPDSDVLRSQIYQLRSKLDKPFSRSLIKTVHRIGFKIECENDL